MTLEEAIEHALEVSKSDSECARQHAQLAHWLSEYRDILLAQEHLLHALNLVSNAREELLSKTNRL